MKSPSWPVLIGAVFLLSVAAVGSLAYRLGAFREVTLERRQTGPFSVVAKEHLGSYHLIAEVIFEVETWAKSIGEPCTLSFGEYRDDPETTDEDRLHSRGGCLATPGNDKIKEAAEAAKLPNGYATGTIEARDTVVATFSGAPSIGPWKVYPKAMQYIQDLELKVSGPVLEIYEIVGEREGRTQYLFPVTGARQ